MSAREDSVPRLAVLGLVLLLVLGALVTTSVLVYRKAMPWQRTVEVTLMTQQAGLELNVDGDVKLRGRVVGRVSSITSDGTGATVRLALDRDEVDLVPADLDAAIVPKTLFGEKYVDLLPLADQGAADLDGPHIADGAVIRQTSTAVELGALFDRLVPLLRAVDPAQLSMLLNGTARTLDGRGEQIGRIVDQGGAFLAELEPHLPALQTDLRLLTETLRSYDVAAPDLLAALDSSAGISRELLVPAEQRLRELLDTLVVTADTGAEVLEPNADAIVELTGSAQPLLALLDQYSGSLPCSLRGLAVLDRLGNQVTGARGPFTLLNVDLLVQGDPYVFPRDLPTDPRSEANNANLPDAVPSWRPHCPRFGTLTRQVRDAQAFTLEPFPFQTVRDGGQGGPSGQSTGGAGRVTDPRLADALAALLGDDADAASSGAPGLPGLLVGPMLYDGEVTVP